MRILIQIGERDSSCRLLFKKGLFMASNRELDKM